MALPFALLGCEAAQVVDCGMSGRFVEAAGDHWCLYPASSTDRCPPALPKVHTLPWGGRGCAMEEHDPVPHELCVAAGACAADGGAP